MGCHLLFQGIFLTQGSNLHFLLLRWQVDYSPLRQLLLNTSHYGWNTVVSGLFYASLENNFYFSKQLFSGQFSSVAQSCPILCDPMDCSTPGFPVLHHLPEFCSNSCPLTQWCYPMISSSVAPFSSCPQSFPAQGLFQWVSSSHQMT